MKDKERRRRIIIILFLAVGMIGIFAIIYRLLTTTAPGDSSAAECTRITFDTYQASPTLTYLTTEDLQISNQYQNLGYTFRNGPRFDGSACDRALPFIAKQGDPFRSFGNNTLSLSDMPAPGETFGPSWLTNESWDGTIDQQNRPCSLEILFDISRPTNQFSFDILDLDYGERWIIEGFANVGDTTPVVTQNVNATNNAAGDGKAFRVAMSSVTPVKMIRIRPALLQKADGGSWGLGFDNFSAFCINDPAPVCGDGVLSASRGEQCDDGNATSGDGCSATCQLETITPAQCFNLVNVVVPTSSSATLPPSSASSGATSSVISSTPTSSTPASSTASSITSSATSSQVATACVSLVQNTPAAATSYPVGTVFTYTATFTCSGLDNNLGLGVARTNTSTPVGNPLIGAPTSSNYNAATNTCTYTFTWTATANLTAGNYSVYLLANSTVASAILTPPACVKSMNLTVPTSSATSVPASSSTTSLPVSSATSLPSSVSSVTSTPVSSAVSSVTSTPVSSAVSSVTSTPVSSAASSIATSTTTSQLPAACISLTQTSPAVATSYPPGTVFNYTAVFSCNGLDPNAVFTVVRAGTNAPVGTPGIGSPTSSNYDPIAHTCTYTFTWSATGIVSSGSYIAYLIAHGITTSSNINL